MSGTISIKNLIAALQQSGIPSSYQGIVGTGSSTTSIVDSVGGFDADEWKDYGVQFTQNTATAALRGQWTKITANTGNTLTVSPALPATPASGDTYDIRIFGSRVINIESVGGTSQTGADWTPLFQAIADALAADGAAVPSKTLQIGGSDGTDLRALLMDALGRPIITATGTLTDGSGSIAAAGTSQQVFAAKTDRRYFIVQNPASASSQGIATAEPLFVNFGAAATETEPSIELSPGDIFAMEDGFIDTEAINVIAATVGHKFTSKEA